MATNVVSTAMDKLRGATSVAFDRAREGVGLTNDQDLAAYARLTPEDFSALVQKFGPDEIVSYIRSMESKLQKVK